jgi:uncharacterized membrane protein (DUF2068 family)
MNSSKGGLIRLVALFKLVKAAALIAAGIGILKLMHADVSGALEHWFVRVGLDPDSPTINNLLEKATRLSPQKMAQLGLVSFFYAGLFLTEGTGLWLLKRWAEWLTVIITSSLVPFEIYEICRQPNFLKVGALVVNVAIVAYLIYRIVSDGRSERTRDHS